jgi:hypothetical protein
MEAEIENLKRQHQARIERLKRTSVLKTAEKKLRAASSLSERSVPNANAGDQQNNDVLDDIAQEVEGSLHKKIEQVSGVTVVERGGLEEQAPIRSMSMSSSSKPQMSPVKTAASPMVAQNQPQVQQSPQPQGLPPQMPPTNGAAPSEMSTAAQPQPEQQAEPQEGTPGGDNGQELDLADNDLDINMDGLDDGMGNGDELVNPDDDWVMDMGTDQVDENSGDQPTQQTSQPSEVPVLQPVTDEAPKAAPQNPTSAGQTPNTGTPADQGQGEQLEGDEFGEAFGDADTAGDALASYGDGNDEDLNLDDSAFGDAFQHDDLS